MSDEAALRRRRAGDPPRGAARARVSPVLGLDTPPPPRFIDGGIFLKHVLREGTLQGKSGISLAGEPERAH